MVFAEGVRPADFWHKPGAVRDCNMPRLTKTFVESIPTPDTVATFAWDEKLSGFGIKVLPSGSRKYVLKYRTHGGRAGTQRWLSLGAHGAVTCDQARILA